jgi:hypothetical protein
MGWFSKNKEKITDSFILEEMDTVSMALSNATHLNLEVEIVTYAIQNMKDNPNLTVGEAITMAYFEWAK